MTKLTTEEIRSKFISYFVANNHIHVPASSLIPHIDPSLMFVNCGMVQFKIFLQVRKLETIKEPLLVRNHYGLVVSIMILKMLVILHDIIRFLKC